MFYLVDVVGEISATEASLRLGAGLQQRKVR